MKSTSKAQAKATRFEIEQGPIGIIEHWEPFNKEDNLTWELEL